VGRVVTNNAASTQPPRELLELYQSLAPWYENVHRGQSAASQHMTSLFEESYDTIATWLNAPSRRNIVTYRNATEAINAVMYSLLTEFRDGDNVVTTMMEHNSNFVPWHALSREILPRFGRRVECRLARFDHRTGELDLDHLARLVDARTKLVCVTGASNFLGTKPPLPLIRRIADDSGYPQPSGERRSLLLVDAAQLAPSSVLDVQALDVDYLADAFGVLDAAQRAVEALFGGGAAEVSDAARPVEVPALGVERGCGEEGGEPGAFHGAEQDAAGREAADEPPSAGGLVASELGARGEQAGRRDAGMGEVAGDAPALGGAGLDHGANGAVAGEGDVAGDPTRAPDHRRRLPGKPKRPPSCCR
jgi:hypothetical protein